MAKYYDLGEAPVDATRLHLNEFRGQHPPSVLAAIEGSLPSGRQISCYSSGPSPALQKMLAEYVNVPEEFVRITAGSDEALRAIVNTCGHEKVIIGIPSYTPFEMFARIRGLQVLTYVIGLKTPAKDIDTSLRYFNAEMRKGCLVYLCSPNNPTGQSWSTSAIQALSRDYPRSTFIVDEAYTEFAAADFEQLKNPREMMNAASAAGLAIEAENIIVVRTMSKVFGLASLRVGYAVGTAVAFGDFDAAIDPKAFSPAASAVAAAALAELKHYGYYAAETKNNAEHLAEEIRGLGWFCTCSPCFLLIYFGPRISDIVRSLDKAGIYVRTRNTLPGLAGFARVSIGNDEDNKKLVRLLRTETIQSMHEAYTKPPQVYFTMKGHVAACKSLLRETVEMLRAADKPIEFFAVAGTLLGTVRHKGMIPWDDDCDLGYVRTPGQEDPVELLRSSLTGRLSIQRNRTDAYWQIGTNRPGEPLSPAHIDLFSFAPTADGGFEVDDPRFKDEKPHAADAACDIRFREGELYPLRQMPFYDMMLPVPAQAETVLKRALGENYMTRARIRQQNGQAIEFTLSEFSPA